MASNQYTKPLAAAAADNRSRLAPQLVTIGDNLAEIVRENFLGQDLALVGEALLMTAALSANVMEATADSSLTSEQIFANLSHVLATAGEYLYARRDR